MAARKSGKSARRVKASAVRAKSGPLLDVAALTRLAARNKLARAMRKAKPMRSVHKRRSRWFQTRATWPYRETSAERVVAERARGRAKLRAANGKSTWQLVGPTNIGGRMTCVAGHPKNPAVLWAGSAGGGVWHTRDSGVTWTALWHDQPSLNVGSLAIDPVNPRILYCGTGEANLSADSYPGVGLFVSRDGGRNWRLLATSAGGVVPARIGAIAIDPFDRNHIVIGGIGYSDATPGGLYASHDAGKTWRRDAFISRNNYWCHAVVFDPSRKGRLYAAVTERGMQNGIWQSTDGGATWRQLRNGLPDASLIHRTSLAVAASDPDVLYAQISDEEGFALGVFKSTNGGSAWKEIGGFHFGDEEQMTYNNVIAVHPKDADRVLCGGVDLHRTHDGGDSWYRVTRWDDEVGNPHYAHSDHHALWIPPGDPDRIYDFNDGGMDVSSDGGSSWENRSQGLAVTMFYDLDVCQADIRLFGGGSQDNGTLITVDGSKDGFEDWTGGDGGFLVFDPKSTQHFFGSIYEMELTRFRGLEWTDVTPPAPEAERTSMWMVVIAMDPANSKRLFTASKRVWRTTDDGDSWQAVSDELDGSDVTAIEIARGDPLRIYVGTENGGFFRSEDGGETWSGDLASSALPGYTITRIASKPDDAELVFATVANFDHRHVFCSRDGGLSWSDVDAGRLPDVPYHVVEFVEHRPNTIVVGGDAGVFVSEDLGKTWEDLTRNLPNASIVDVVYHEATKTISAATYGRSIWRLAL